MKVSSKGRYGIGILLELALSNGNLMSAREIAEKQEISLKYTEQILNIFNKAGFVHSQRGSSGGYSLAVDEESITVGEMLRVTEGQFAVVDCLESPEICTLTDQCISRKVWKEIQTSIENVVDNITIKDLIDDYNNNQNFVYMI